MKVESWKTDIASFCKKYNIPIDYLANTLNEPKVIPMIRGKAFEFSVLEKLRSILNSNIWEVKKDIINAQLGSHDEDVSVIHRKTSKKLSIECKLAGKGRFKKLKDGNFIINVKCMRSRTMGEIVVQRLAPQLGITIESLTLHNDQYRESDFDLVVSSIGNAFYETDDEGLFFWNPSNIAEEFMKKLFQVNDTNLLQELAFNKMYVALSKDLAVGNGFQTCVRRGCDKDNPCGFIPNYPPIHFDKDTLLPTNGWVPIESIENLILQLI